MRSRRFSKEEITDVAFADNIVVISDYINPGHRLLENIENSAGTVGMDTNGNNTKVITINIKDECNILMTASD